MIETERVVWLSNEFSEMGVLKVSESLHQSIIVTTALIGSGYSDVVFACTRRMVKSSVMFVFLFAFGKSLWPVIPYFILWRQQSLLLCFL